MSYTYLRSREHYEKRYDDGTVERCRMGERVVNQTFTEVGKKLPAAEKEGRQASWYLMYSRLYFVYVETAAAERQYNREKQIEQWMKADEQKDTRLAGAQPAKIPYCKACGKDMEEFSRDYMPRNRTGSGGREEDILFMMVCKSCDKRTAVWQDGAEWERKEPRCEKCGSIMKSKSSKKFGVITTTKTCTSCGHIEKYDLDLNGETEEETREDPYLELDRRRFCFDTDMESKYMQKLNHLLRMGKLELDTEEHAEHIDIYEAVKDIRQLKIAELSDLLRDALAEAGYRDFKLGDPELGQQVVIGFSCLDGKSDRKEYDSKKQLLKLVKAALEETNWRLMGSNGVDYRLGFLNGRLRAYEKEEDLKTLIEQRVKAGTYRLPEKKPAKAAKKNEPDPKYEGERLREAALVYLDKMMIGHRPAEITLKSGKKKSTGIPYMTAEMNPLLRVIIPMRDGDDSVPEFIRSYDFKMGPKDDDTPKVTKDKLGRKVSLT